MASWKAAALSLSFFSFLPFNSSAKDKKPLAIRDLTAALVV
jgi:hypothetical protein